MVIIAFASKKSRKPNIYLTFTYNGYKIIKNLVLKRSGTMKDKNIVRENELNDAREMAKFITDKRKDLFLHKVIGIALFSYMNGVRDTERTIRTMQITT